MNWLIGNTWCDRRWYLHQAFFEGEQWFTSSRVGTVLNTSCPRTWAYENTWLCIFTWRPRYVQTRSRECRSSRRSCSDKVPNLDQLRKCWGVVKSDKLSSSWRILAQWRRRLWILCSEGFAVFIGRWFFSTVIHSRWLCMKFNVVRDSGNPLEVAQIRWEQRSWSVVTMPDVLVSILWQTVF